MTHVNYSGIERLFQFLWLTLVCLILVYIFLMTPLTNLFGLPTYLEEVILVFTFIYSLFKSKTDILVKKVLILYLISFAFFMMLSFKSIPVRGLSLVTLQVFIHLKYMLCVIFFWSVVQTDGAKLLAKMVLIITVIFLFFNLLTGDLFNQIFGAPTLIRTGYVRPIGIQADTASLGTTLALGGCLLICNIDSKELKTKLLLFILFTLLVVIASTRTSLLLLPLTLVWWLRSSIKSFSLVLILISGLFIFANSSKHVDQIIQITTDNIEWTTENPVESGYIRGIMLFFSFEIANDNFPFGTGASTYGTVTSDDSPVYVELGLHNSRFFYDKEGIYDSNFASLLGEFGYVGMMIYYYIFYLILTIFTRVIGLQHQKEFRFVFFFLVVGYSVATPVFMNSYPAFLIGLLITASYSKTELTSDKIVTVVK